MSELPGLFYYYNPEKKVWNIAAVNTERYFRELTANYELFKINAVPVEEQAKS